MAMPAIGSVTRSPSTRISPSSIGISPSTQRSSVVFPQPDGPTRATISRSPISRSMLRKTSNPPKRFPTPLTRMWTVAG
jgi:hypothetical protein